MKKRTSISGAIGYVRVSTRQQGESGIGLEAQRIGIRKYAAHHGIEILHIYSDIASARGDANLEARPGLREALRFAEASGMDLFVYSLDRLTRCKETSKRIFENYNVSVLSVSEGRRLDPAVIKSLSARAEYEGDLISRRTAEAMANLKAKGVALGNPRLEEAREVAAQANKDASLNKARQIANAIQQNSWHDLSRRKLAEALNSIGIYTRRNKPWNKERLRDPLRLARTLLLEDEAGLLGEHPLYGRF